MNEILQRKLLTLTKQATSQDDLLKLSESGQITGIFKSMPASWYHEGPGIGSTDIRNLLRSAAHFRAERDKRFHGDDDEESFSSRQKESAALLFGSAAHTAVLENHLFDDLYWTIDPKDKLNWSTKEGKAQKADLLEKHKGKTELKHAMFLRIAELSETVRANQKVMKLLDGALIELTAYAPYESALRRVRPDAYNVEKGLVVDLKTTQDARPEAFARSILNHGYHIQAAYYMDALRDLGLPVTAFVFVAVEKSPPYAIGLYMLSEKFFALGRSEWQRGLEVFRDASQSGIWPAYDDTVATLDLPRWVASDLIDDVSSW